MTGPTCTIIAGPNGAGKTTFAITYLPTVANCRNFVNADLIAAGLSPLAPERELVAAGKLLLREIRGYVTRRESFAFETTLAGRTYLNLLRRLRASGWQVDLVYLWLPSIEMSVARIAERAAHGGHNIPTETVVRRYPRSIVNLLEHYAPMCNSTTCYDNSTTKPVLVFTQDAHGRHVQDAERYEQLVRAGRSGS